MPYDPSNDPFESALDRLFQANRTASPDFTARTLTRIRAEAASADGSMDDWLEGELAANRIQPAPGFTERARQRIHREKAPLIQFPLPLFIRSAAGIAAAIAVLFAVGRSQMGPAMPTADTALMAQVEQTSHALELDPAATTLLMLAEGLDPNARWLLEGGDNAALMALAR